jgi:hypothetical protein
MARQPAGEAAPPTTWPAVVWVARLCVYLLAQGALVLLAYAYYGFDSNPQSFAPGFRIDPLLAALNLLWGAAGTYIGFFGPRYALPFVLVCAGFYLALAALGSFTPYHFGMGLADGVALFHWLISLPALAIGLYALWRKHNRR